MPEAGTVDDPLLPVEASRRVLTQRDAFGRWFSLGTGPLVPQAVALLAGSLAAGVVG